MKTTLIYFYAILLTFTFSSISAKDTCDELDVSIFKLQTKKLSYSLDNKKNFLNLQAEADRLKAKIAIYRGLATIKKEYRAEFAKLYKNEDFDLAIKNFKTSKASRMIHVENFIDELILDMQKNRKNKNTPLNVVNYKAKLKEKCLKYKKETTTDNSEICNQLLKDSKSFKAVKNFFNLYNRATFNLETDRKLLELKEYRNSLSHIETKDSFEQIFLIKSLKLLVSKKAFCLIDSACQGKKQKRIDDRIVLYKKKMDKKIILLSKQEFTDFENKGQNALNLIESTRKTLKANNIKIQKRLNEIKKLRLPLLSKIQEGRRGIENKTLKNNTQDIHIKIVTIEEKIDKQLDVLAKLKEKSGKDRATIKNISSLKKNPAIVAQEKLIDDLNDKRNTILLKMKAIVKDKYPKLASIIDLEAKLLYEETLILNSLRNRYPVKLANSLKQIIENLSDHMKILEGSSQHERLKNIILKLKNADLKDHGAIKKLLISARTRERSWQRDVKAELIKNRPKSVLKSDFDIAVKKLQDSLNNLEYGDPKELIKSLKDKQLEKLKKLFTNNKDLKDLALKREQQSELAKKHKIEGVKKFNEAEFINEALKDFVCKNSDNNLSEKERLIACLKDTPQENIDKLVDKYNKEFKELEKLVNAIRADKGYMDLNASLAKLLKDKLTCKDKSIIAKGESPASKKIKEEKLIDCPPAGIKTVEDKPLEEVSEYMKEMRRIDDENIAALKKDYKRRYGARDKNETHFISEVYNNGYTWDAGIDHLKKSNGFMNYLTGAMGSLQKYIDPRNPQNIVWLAGEGYMPNIMMMEFNAKNMVQGQYLTNYWTDMNQRTAAAMFTFRGGYNMNNYGTTPTDGSYNWGSTSSELISETKSNSLPLPHS